MEGEVKQNRFRRCEKVRCVLGAAAFLIAVLLSSCEEGKEHIAPAIHDRDSVSMMTSYGVNTLISDSGVIKYRIVAERWDVNTVRQPNRWTFIKGIFFEQFDEQFHVQLYVQADTAWYWAGYTHELYSHCLSRLVTPERTLQGTYFRSDERMTRYTVSNSKGSFDKSDMEDDGATPADTVQTDTAVVPQVPVRQAARPRAASTVTTQKP